MFDNLTTLDDCFDQEKINAALDEALSPFPDYFSVKKRFNDPSLSYAFFKSYLCGLYIGALFASGKDVKAELNMVNGNNSEENTFLEANRKRIMGSLYNLLNLGDRIQNLTCAYVKHIQLPPEQITVLYYTSLSTVSNTVERYLTKDGPRIDPNPLLEEIFPQMRTIDLAIQ